MDDMGTFRIDVELENPAVLGTLLRLDRVLVDTGAELSWFPAVVLESLGVRREKQLQFRQADGSVLTRWSGWAIIHASGTRTIDEVVFGEPRDLILLGARTMEGLNLRVDPVGKRLIDAGPLPAAAST
jgi:predicted aspartyl protease